MRVAAGTFGPGAPRRDLFLSPDHAVFIDGVLIPVRHLIDNNAIAQIPVDEIRYFHVELASHSIVLAEGLRVESYLDTGDRANFANGGRAVALHPDFATRTWETKGCAPLVMTGPELEAARRKVSLVRRRSRHETGVNLRLAGASRAV